MKSLLPRQQKGMTLVSLMIASAIGIFLVGAVLKIYIDSKNSFNMRNTVSEVAENQRFAIDDMRRILVMAGREIRAIEDQFPNRRPFPAVGANGIVDNGNSGSDTIAIRYRLGPSCGNYQNVPLTNLPTMVRFYVNGNNELVCEMTENGGTPTTRVLASDVLLLKALYGVDDDTDGYANRYLTPTEINNQGISWASVVSLRFALLFESPQEMPVPYRQTATPDKLILRLRTSTMSSIASQMDGKHLYRVASTTLALRNLHPTVQRQ